MKKKKDTQTPITAELLNEAFNSLFKWTTQPDIMFMSRAFYKHKKKALKKITAQKRTK